MCDARAECAQALEPESVPIDFQLDQRAIGRERLRKDNAELGPSAVLAHVEHLRNSEQRRLEQLRERVGARQTREAAQRQERPHAARGRAARACKHVLRVRWTIAGGRYFPKISCEPSPAR